MVFTGWTVLSLFAHGFVINLPRGAGQLRIEFNGSRSSVIEGAGKLSGTANYFIGNDVRHWHTGVPTYSKVRYREVYKHVDLLFHSADGGKIEHDWIVA